MNAQTAKKIPMTIPGGPVIASYRVLEALISIKQAKLLQPLFGRILITESNASEIKKNIDRPLPEWVEVVPDHDDVDLPERIVNTQVLNQQTFKACLAIGCSRVLIDGPIKDKAKLSFFKCEGIVSILVTSYRAGRLKLVRPMIKALTSLGYADMLPPEDQIKMIYEALEYMGEPY